MTSLEDKFLAEAEAMNAELQPLVKILEDTMAQVEAVSEKYCLPMELPITPLSMRYVPHGYEKKLRNLLYLQEDMEEKVKEVISKYKEGWFVNGYESEYGYGGWEHSAVC